MPLDDIIQSASVTTALAYQRVWELREMLGVGHSRAKEIEKLEELQRMVSSRVAFLCARLREELEKKTEP